MKGVDVFLLGLSLFASIAAIKTEDEDSFIFALVASVSLAFGLWQ